MTMPGCHVHKWLFAVIFVVSWGLSGRVSGPGDAWAQVQPNGGHSDTGEHERDAGDNADNRINLRVGAASTDRNGRPTLCMEVRAVSRLSVEGCGTGSGFLHHATGGEMAHFRAKWRVLARPLRHGLLRAHAGVGFAELQIDADQPGFVIHPTGDAVAASGPETSFSLQWQRPIRGNWELLLNTSAGLAWIPGAGELAQPQDTLQPFVSFEAGVGW